MFPLLNSLLEYNTFETSPKGQERPNNYNIFIGIPCAHPHPPNLFKLGRAFQAYGCIWSVLTCNAILTKNLSVESVKWHRDSFRKQLPPPLSRPSLNSNSGIVFSCLSSTRGMYPPTRDGIVLLTTVGLTLRTMPNHSRHSITIFLNYWISCVYKIFTQAFQTE